LYKFSEICSFEISQKTEPQMIAMKLFPRHLALLQTAGLLKKHFSVQMLMIVCGANVS
jgi:hypothetical protein